MSKPAEVTHPIHRLFNHSIPNEKRQTFSVTPFMDPVTLMAVLPRLDRFFRNLTCQEPFGREVVLMQFPTRHQEVLDPTHRTDKPLSTFVRNCMKMAHMTQKGNKLLEGNFLKISTLFPLKKICLNVCNTPSQIRQKSSCSDDSRAGVSPATSKN